MADVVSTNPPTMAAPGGHYSHAVTAGGFVFVSGQLPIEFHAESETQFRAGAVNAVIVFRAVAGRPIELVVEQADRRLSATRVE